MDREEILRAVQAEKCENGEYEQSVMRKSVSYGALVGVIICGVLTLIELFWGKVFDPGKPAILFAISGFSNAYEGHYRKELKRKVRGILELVVAFLLFVLAIGVLLV